MTPPDLSTENLIKTCKLLGVYQGTLDPVRYTVGGFPISEIDHEWSQGIIANRSVESLRGDARFNFLFLER